MTLASCMLQVRANDKTALIKEKFRKSRRGPQEAGTHYCKRPPCPITRLDFIDFMGRCERDSEASCDGM